MDLLHVISIYKIIMVLLTYIHSLLGGGGWGGDRITGYVKD